MVGAQVSRNLPDTVLTDTLLLIQQPFWTAFNYNADSLAPVLNDLTDYYMNLFPATELWCSVDYVKFEYNASSRPVNYLASLYTSYGLTHYPDRFGLFREDLSGCNPPPVINNGYHWYILQQNPCATGAQMLWSVQDGPDRMNQCNMVPNTESFVLDSAIQHGLTLGMRYMEIYGADVDDSTLSTVISYANNALIQKGNYCMVQPSLLEEESNASLIWPVPASNEIKFSCNAIGKIAVSIISSTGQICLAQNIVTNGSLLSLNIPVELIDGLYFLRILSAEKCIHAKFIVSRNEN
jgi:hypothetical protein